MHICIIPIMEKVGIVDIAVPISLKKLFAVVKNVCAH